MSAIFDQIKSNAVPVGVMRTAAKGALPVESAEMLEILVYLTRNPVFGEDARMTLAGWDFASAVQVLSDPAAPPEVLGYYWMEANRRPGLMPALIGNPAIAETMVMELAMGAGREMVTALLASPRVRNSPALMEALASNPELTPKELQSLQGATPALAEEFAEEDGESRAAHQAWQQDHAAEIAAEEGKPFEMVGQNEDEEPGGAQGTSEESQSEAPHEAQAQEASPANAETAPASTNSTGNLATTALAAGSRDQAKPVEGKKLTVLQKIGRMNAAERVKAAFSGGREERMILIRDAARVVQNGVLASPKLTEPEVETFAGAKNVSENVLREIARSRRFMKNYNVVRNLVNNPKCPLDLSLNWVKSLLVHDLKSLRNNKNVPETIRQVAFKLYREKSGPSKEAKRSG
jgi:hypothetical protein